MCDGLQARPAATSTKFCLQAGGIKSGISSGEGQYSSNSVCTIRHSTQNSSSGGSSSNRRHTRQLHARGLLASVL